MIKSFSSFINEEVEGVGFNMTTPSKRKLTPREEIDPFGEEKWWETGPPEPTPVRPVRRPGRIAVAIGMDREAQRPNRRVCVFQQPFPGVRNNRELGNNFSIDSHEVLLETYYNRNHGIFTCPSCGRVSNQVVIHGDGWICGGCGIKMRMHGNSLRYWD